MQRWGALLVGIIFVGVGIFLYFRNDHLAKVCTVEAEATVVDMKEELSTDDTGTGYMYYPIIEYKAGEETVTATMDQGSSTPAYRINTKITILYNPKDTKEFIVKGDKGSQIMSYVMIGLGAAITVYGLVVVFKKN